MTDDSAGIDDLLCRLTGDPVPGPATIDAGMLRLLAAMRQETATPTRRSTTPWLRRVAVAAAVVAMALAVSVLTPAEVTALGDLAEVAETVAPTIAAEGQYVYRVTEQTGLQSLSRADLGIGGSGDVTYLRSVEVHTWEGADAIREEVILGSAEFFDPTAEAAYRGSSAEAREKPGTVVSSERERVPFPLDARLWPIATDALRGAMEAHVSNLPAETPEAAQLIDLAGELLRDPRIAADLRGAVIRVLDGIDGVVVGHVDDGVTVSLRYTAPPGGDTVYTLAFDGQGRLLRETETWMDGNDAAGVPAGTTIFDRRYGIPMVVDSLG
ncbi:MAG: hypothetical protein H0V96_09785 [Acidimicrobiia bacterium]|nr:hypothetical protein [Acidimicrobiia bacterium]